MSRNMDIIRIWIDGICHEVKKADLSKWHKKKLLRHYDRKMGPYSTKLHLPSEYYRILKWGSQKENLQWLECETETVITLPKGRKDGILEISGSSEDSVQMAKEDIISLVAHIRESSRAKQFICIPLLSDEIQKNLQIFKDTILKENHDGVEEALFQKQLKFHLTVVVFVLLNDQEIERAKATLKECKEYIFKKTDDLQTPMRILVKGLNCMDSNLKRANVLYAEANLVDGSGNLQVIVNAISNLFNDKGLVKGYKENVKIHATLMNTNKRVSDSSNKKRWQKKIPFDASKIIEKYKDFYFGEAIFDTLNLSLISSESEDGCYKSLDSIKF